MEEAVKDAKPLRGNRSRWWAIGDTFEVPDLDRPSRNYLWRLRLVQTPWFGIYLHRFDTPDSRPTLHDHPWPFLSLLIRGSYSEVTDYRKPPHHVRCLNVKGKRSLHYISELHRPVVWSLVLVGRRSREWGYLDPDGTWTRFDLHPHAEEFDLAMRARECADNVGDRERADDFLGVMKKLRRNSLHLDQERSFD